MERMIPGLVGEIHNALDKHMGPPSGEICKRWPGEAGARAGVLAKTCRTAHTPVDLFNGVHKIVTQTVSYAFVGHPLCRRAIPCP